MHGSRAIGAIVVAGMMGRHTCVHELIEGLLISYFSSPSIDGGFLFVRCAKRIDLGLEDCLVLLSLVVGSFLISCATISFDRND